MYTQQYKRGFATIIIKGRTKPSAWTALPVEVFCSDVRPSPGRLGPSAVAGRRPLQYSLIFLKETYSDVQLSLALGPWSVHGRFLQTFL